jgi:hypothetical protein
MMTANERSRKVVAMPAQPDRDTLRLRVPDRRTPAEAARVVARELARRPRAARWDVKLSPPDRALAMFRENYPGLAERYPPGVLWAVAHGHGQPGARSAPYPCGWCLARAYAKGHGQPLPQLDRLGLAVLGPGCVDCDPPPPPPKPKPKRAVSNVRSPRSRSGTNRTRAARSSTSTTRGRAARAPLTAAAERARVAAYVAGGPMPPSPSRAAYNAAAMRRLGMDPATAPHLTGGRS